MPINVPELSIAERSGLLSRYATIRGLEIDRSDLAYFKDFLSGFPEQIFFTVELIKQHGLSRARNMTRLIIDFNTRLV
jgi:hypothetical protein